MAEEGKSGAGRGRAALWAGLLLVLLVAGAGFWWRSRTPPAAPPPPAPPERPAPARAPVRDQPVIDYDAMGERPELRRMMDRRKAEYGLGDGVDLIVRGDETLRIGDRTVSMAEIRRQIELEAGRMIEAPLDGAPEGDGAGSAGVYGIHVVRPGDNIWNIHFGILKAYFDRRGVRVSPLADEPRDNGTSSGVGRLLKFSEGMVSIYNLREGRLEKDLDLIYPLSKIVVYNMGQVFALLDPVDPARIDRIRFDGETLWLPPPS